MNVFQDYAAFYDRLYHDKAYGEEVAFLERVFAGEARAPVRRVLDLGCGTGGHALPLARRGYAVTGLDRSEPMLAQARSKAAAAGLAVRFVPGDLAAFDLGETFDAAICMFAVLGYLTADDALAAGLAAIRRHLAPGALFVFDCWFGPAVMRQGPTERTLEVGGPGGRIVRQTRPTVDLTAQVVFVEFTVRDDAAPGGPRDVREVHPMRFFFPAELRILLAHAGFRLVHLCPFLRLGEAVDADTWNVSVVARAEG